MTRLARPAGLTLIEVTMALALLSLVIVGLFAAVNISMKGDALTREQQAASEEATRQLDAWLSQPNHAFDTTVETFHVLKKTGNGEVALTPAATAPINADRPPAEQERVGRISSVVGARGRGANYAEITVSVRWRTVDGTDQQYDLVSAQVREE